MKRLWPISACAMLAACAHAGTGVARDDGNSALADAAALLAESEQAGGPEARAQYLQGLDRLQVTLADGGTPEEDTLARWRAEAVSLRTAAASGQKPPPFRGRALGPGYRRATIQPGETIHIEQIFYAGQRAEIAGQSLGGQPVQLDIRNQRTQQVCAAKLKPAGSCKWMPLFTERFRIELANHSQKPASVYIVFK